MSKQHLDGNPHKIKGTKDAWWYEEFGHITVVVHRDAINQDIGSVLVEIPWKSIRAALARKDQK